MAKKSTPIKTLAKNVKAASKGVTKVKKVVSKKQQKFERLQGRRSYKFRDLPIKAHKSVKAYAQELENHPELDSLKQPGEMWAFTIYGHNSHQIFESIDLAAGYLSKYRQLDKVDIDKVRFVKFGKPGKKPLTEKQYRQTVDKYQAEREKKVKRHKVRREKVETHVKEQVAKQTGKKPATNLDALEALSKLNDTLVARLEKLEKMLATKPVKKAAKKATKKTAPVKGGKKNAASKPKGSKPKTGKAKASTKQKGAQKTASKKKAAPKGKAKGTTGKKPAHKATKRGKRK